MVIIFHRKTCTSSRKAIKWFDNHSIKYKMTSIRKITKKDLVEILSLTDHGLDSILKVQGEKDVQKKISKVQEMSLKNALEYLEIHSEILRCPIIISKNKLLVGYHETEIRTFIPRNKRL